MTSNNLNKQKLKQPWKTSSKLSNNFLAIQAYLKKQEKYQINNLTLYLKKLEKEDKEEQKHSKSVVEEKS